MRITYNNKRFIFQALKEAKAELWRYIEFQKKIKQYKFKSINFKYTFQTLQKEQSIYKHLDMHIVNAPIMLLGELLQSKSKYLDTDELIDDVLWIERYLKKKKYSSVIRWMSNVQSTIDKIFTEYMDEIRALPNNQNNNFKGRNK